MFGKIFKKRLNVSGGFYPVLGYFSGLMFEDSFSVLPSVVFSRFENLLFSYRVCKNLLMFNILQKHK